MILPGTRNRMVVQKLILALEQKMRGTAGPWQSNPGLLLTPAIIKNAQVRQDAIRLKGLKIELQIWDLVLELLETHILLALENVEPMDTIMHGQIYRRIIHAPNLSYPDNYYREDNILIIRTIAEEYLNMYGLVLPNAVFAKRNCPDENVGLILVFE